MLAEDFVPLRVQLQVVLVVVEKVELDSVFPNLLQEIVVVYPVVWGDFGLVFSPKHILLASEVEREHG